MTLKAGVATIDITPSKPLFLVGYPHVPRTSTGVHDSLCAAALCLDDGRDAVISIAVDNLFVTHPIADLCRAGISHATGVPISNILISVTHTHSGPSTADILAWRDDPTVPPPDAEYVQRFRTGIIEAGTTAHARRTDAVAAITTANGLGVGGNRHAPDGPADPEVGLIYLKTKTDDRPLALQMIYCMHPTVMHEDSKLISGDFPAYARQHIRESIGGLDILYHTGPSGNQSPRYHVSGQTFAEAERLGRKLGAAVLDSLNRLQDAEFSDDLPLAGTRRFVQLPPREFCSVPEAQELLEEAYADYERLKRENAGHGPIRTAECTTFGAEERVTLAQAQADGTVQAIRKAYSPTEVQVLRIGPAVLVGLRGECFVEYDLDIKLRAPVQAFVISLANGELQGYIVTPEATGYEAGLSFFMPEAGQLMADATVELIAELM